MSRAESSSSFAALDQVDLVEEEKLRLAAFLERIQDRLRLFAHPRMRRLLLRVDQERQHVGVSRRAPGGGDHRAVEAALRREEAGRVDEDDLGLAAHHDAAHGRARRLRLAGDDRHLLADERVDQRRLAGVRRADQGDEAAAGRAHVALQRSRKAWAAACSAARLELASPVSGSKPVSTTRMTKWGACAGPLRAASS